MSDEQAKRKREQQRQTTVSFVWYQLLDDTATSDDDDSHCGIAHSCDVSSSGLGLYTPRPLPAGQMVFVELATSKGNVSAVGRVVYSKELKPGYHRVGIRLDVVPPNHRPILAKILRDAT